MEFHERLRRARTAAGLQQMQVAQAAGIPYSTYRSYELGSATPKATVLPALARALKTDPNSLVGWQDPTT